MTPSDAVRLARVRRMATSGEAKDVRISVDLSQREMADAIGVTDATISRWESGQRAPRGKPALRYLRLLEHLQQEPAQ